MSTERQRGIVRYFLQLASNLKRLEEVGDREGLAWLRRTHGERDCLLALEAASQHEGPLPPPDVWEPEPEPKPEPEV